jgi:hypothetical protein
MSDRPAHWILRVLRHFLAFLVLVVFDTGNLRVVKAVVLRCESIVLFGEWGFEYDYRCFV